MRKVQGPSPFQTFPSSIHLSVLPKIQWCNLIKQIHQPQLRARIVRSCPKRAQVQVFADYSHCLTLGVAKLAKAAQDSSQLAEKRAGRREK